MDAYLQAKNHVSLPSCGILDMAMGHRKCHHYGEVWYVQKNCPKVSVNLAGSMVTTKSPEIKCYNCDTKGHIAMHYPTLFAGNSKGSCSPQWGLVKKGSRVKVLGCSQTLAQEQLVPKNKIMPHKFVNIQCAHGDSVVYPVARVGLEVERVPIVVEAAVSSNLSRFVLLGTDVEE